MRTSASPRGRPNPKRGGLHYNDRMSPRADLPNFLVRDIPVYGDLILSPMAGFSDMPYRSLCRELGSAMSYTEFVSAIGLLQGKNERALRMLAYREQERPVVFQIFDSEEQRLEDAARLIEQLGPDIIDLNMGCSVNKVSGRGAGAGLLREPAKIARIISRMVAAVQVPVTGKIRLGWCQGSLNYLDVVRILEDAGANLVAVHGRTRSQAYKGTADWDAIAEIVQAVEIPIIGNGDVRTVADIERIRSHTGCAGVMIGRGAIGHPWIFQRRDRHEIPFSDKAEFIRRHFRRMSEFYGDRMSLILIRKHIARYLKGYSGIKDLHLQLVQVQSVDDFYRLLQETTRRIDPAAVVLSG